MGDLCDDVPGSMQTEATSMTNLNELHAEAPSEVTVVDVGPPATLVMEEPHDTHTRNPLVPPSHQQEHQEPSTTKPRSNTIETISKRELEENLTQIVSEEPFYESLLERQGEPRAK